MAPRVSLVRHAQGLHNLCEANNSLRDPALTPLGKEQSSPLRRTLETCILSFSTVVQGGIKITALPDAQEISGLMCDVGTERSQLEAEFGDKVDFSLVLDNWNDKSEFSRFAPTATKLERRARDVRLWIQDIAKQGGEDAHIVLVSHGGILHFITQEWDDIKPGRGTGWENTECREYEFVDSSLRDPKAKLREVDSSWRRRRGSTIPLTTAEQEQLRVAYPDTLETGL
ncbi:hypothetical protein G7054_g5742 [Neopestalotiopsis clavispora]|nr:hypothetical protein G7054_g5742 [Neopestalotiopsis clavispora]